MSSQFQALRVGRIREEAYFAEQDRILLEQLREVMQLQAEAAAACCSEGQLHQHEAPAQGVCPFAALTNENRVASYHAIC